MAYGRSSIAPYYLNTIAKNRADKEMLDKRIKAQKDEAAKDRWFKAGMGVVDIGARFGLQAYDDYLKRERKKESVMGPRDAFGKSVGDAPAQAPDPVTAPPAAPPAAPMTPPPSMRKDEIIPGHGATTYTTPIEQEMW